MDTGDPASSGCGWQDGGYAAPNETYEDAEATLHEAQQIQDHLKAQDDAIGTLLDKIARLEAARGQA